MKKKLSIGITSYNNDPFIYELLENIKYNIVKDPSILNEVDFYLYDDASDEDVKKSFEEYKDYCNIIYGEYNSGTPSMGRNTILEKANSKYILFIDGDDNIVSPISEIVENLRYKTSDLILSDVRKINVDGIITESPMVYSAKIFKSDTSYFNQTAFKIGVHQTGIWSIYRVDYLRENNLEYSLENRYEDNLFMTHLYLTNPTIDRIFISYYGWRNNYSNFTSSEKSREERVKLYKNILEILSNDLENEVSPYLLYSVWNQTYSNIIRGYMNLSYQENKRYFNNLKKIEKEHKETIKELQKGIDKKYSDSYFKYTKLTILHNFYFIYMLYLVNKIIKKRKNTTKFKKKMLKVFTVLPINKKKIFMTSQYGQYSDNTKYLYLKMKEDPKYKDYKFVFAVKDKSLLTNKDMIDYNNRLKFYYHHYTAKYVYFNTWIDPMFAKRKNQDWIQLWHGVPYKKVHTDINVYQDVFSEQARRNRQISIDKWDYIYSVNQYNTKIFANLFPNVKIIEEEYPKTQWLIDNKENKELIEKLQKKYNVDEKTVLYAPTYRPYEVLIDVNELRSKINQDEKILIHNHPMLKVEYINEEDEKEINEVDDIQELILATGKLITDYSSIQHDYKKLNKEVIIYAPDKKLYNQIHGIY